MKDLTYKWMGLLWVMMAITMIDILVIIHFISLFQFRYDCFLTCFQPIFLFTFSYTLLCLGFTTGADSSLYSFIISLMPNSVTILELLSLMVDLHFLRMMGVWNDYLLLEAFLNEKS